MSLHERFELGALLGAGAMGRVHAATHRRSGLEVAVKRMAPDADPERFAHEVSAVAQLDHPHVVWVIDQGRDASGRPWLAMQRATGTLADETGARWSRIRAALVRLLDALAHAHARGVIHRDIKPSNVLLGCRRDPSAPLVDPIDGLCLADFGLASTRNQLATAGGTLPFMAPERRAGQPGDVESDLYAVGATAVAILTGLPPRVDNGPPAALVPVPPGLDGWLRRLLAPTPETRFRRASHALAGLLALPEVADPTTPQRRPPPAPILTTRAVVEPIAPHGASPEPGTPAGPEWPAVPVDWRPPKAPWPAVALLDAGLGLFHERTPPLVGRQGIQDALWALLRAVGADGRSRLVQLTGPPGVGRRRLGRWIGQRAHELGVAAVAADGPDRVPRVAFIETPSIDAVSRSVARLAAPGPVLFVLAGGASVPDHPAVTSIEVPPLAIADAMTLVRAVLPLDRFLAEELVAMAAGLPGRLIATLEAWVMDDALVATDDGFALRDERTLGDLPRLGVTPDEELARLYEAWWACRRLNQPRKGARLARQRARLVARLGLPDTDRRRSEALFQEITSGYEAVGRPTRVAKARELARLAERHGWTDLEALGRTQLGMVLLDRAEDGEEGMAQLERGAALGAMSATLMAQGNALTNLGAQLAGRGRLDEAGARFREAEALGRDVVPGESDWDARVRSGVLHSALVGRAWLALHQETPEAAIAHAEEAVAVAPSGAVEGMNMLGMILSTVGRTDEAITWRERALASIREQGLRIAEGILLHYLADDYMALGRRDEARTALMRALETFRDRDATDTTIRVRLARLALEEQAWDEADAILDEVDDDRPIHVLLVALHRLTASIGRGLDSRSVATALDHAEEHFAVHAVTDIHVQAATEAVADQLTARGAPPELIARVRDFVERQRRTLARP